LSDSLLSINNRL